jgi:hypothetical protein
LSLSDPDHWLDGQVALAIAIDQRQLVENVAEPRRPGRQPRLHLARSHPFVDCNRHTAHVCYHAFLALNDADPVASDEVGCVNMIALDPEVSCFMSSPVSARTKAR